MASDEGEHNGTQYQYMTGNSIAANTGIVATAVNTTITEVSIMPRVKQIEFIAKAKIKIIP